MCWAYHNLIKNFPWKCRNFHIIVKTDKLNFWFPLCNSVAARILYTKCIQMIIKLRNRSFFLLLLTDMRCKRIYQKSSSSHQQFHHTFSVSYIIIIIITYNLITTLTMYTNIFKALYLAATSTTSFFWKAPHIIRTNRKLYLIYAYVKILSHVLIVLCWQCSWKALISRSFLSLV